MVMPVTSIVVSVLWGRTVVLDSGLSFLVLVPSTAQPSGIWILSGYHSAAAAFIFFFLNPKVMQFFFSYLSSLFLPYFPSPSISFLLQITKTSFCPLCRYKHLLSFTFTASGDGRLFCCCAVLHQSAGSLRRVCQFEIWCHPTEPRSWSSSVLFSWF